MASRSSVHGCSSLALARASVSRSSPNRRITAIGSDARPTAGRFHTSQREKFSVDYRPLRSPKKSFEGNGDTCFLRSLPVRITSISRRSAATRNRSSSGDLVTGLFCSNWTRTAHRPRSRRSPAPTLGRSIGRTGDFVCRSCVACLPSPMISSSSANEHPCSRKSATPSRRCSRKSR